MEHISSAEYWRNQSLEETGILIPRSNWRQFGRLFRSSFEVYLFCATASLEMLARAEKMTDETPAVFRISDLETNEAVIPNLRWMIPMALNMDRGEHAQHFDIQEG